MHGVLFKWQSCQHGREAKAQAADAEDAEDAEDAVDAVLAVDAVDAVDAVLVDVARVVDAVDAEAVVDVDVGHVGLGQPHVADVALHVSAESLVWALVPILDRPDRPNRLKHFYFRTLSERPVVETFRHG